MLSFSVHDNEVIFPRWWVGSYSRKRLPEARFAGFLAESAQNSTPARQPTPSNTELRDCTQLPPVGSHHNVLERPATRQESSDADIDKKAPDPKKIKLEIKEQEETQQDSPMPEIPNPFRIDHSAVFPPHQVFDFTSGDPDDDELNDSKTSDMSRLEPNGGTGGAFHSLARTETSLDGGPEWLDDITESLEGLHVKSDRTHEYCTQLGASIAQHDTRLAHPEVPTEGHSDTHEATLVRLATLEKAVVELDRKAWSMTPPRVPTLREGWKKHSERRKEHREHQSKKPSRH